MLILYQSWSLEVLELNAETECAQKLLSATLNRWKYFYLSFFPFLTCYIIYESRLFTSTQKIVDGKRWNSFICLYHDFTNFLNLTAALECSYSTWDTGPHGGIVSYLLCLSLFLVQLSHLSLMHKLCILITATCWRANVSFLLVSNFTPWRSCSHHTEQHQWLMREFKTMRR